MSHRCIYCGECIRVCPWEAWTVPIPSMTNIQGEGKAVAVLDPAVFGQFGDSAFPQGLMKAFGDIGFYAARSMEEVLESYRDAILHFIRSKAASLPVISSDCPAVVQLVQVKFPSLIENLIPLAPPFEIMAKRLRKGQDRISEKGLYYIVPCLAKAQSAHQPLSPEGGFDGALPVRDLYNSLKTSLHQKGEEGEPHSLGPPSILGMEWAFPCGASQALGMEASLVVDGIHQVADVFELAENGLLEKVPFIEAWGCLGGCLGGPMNVQNPFWARFQMLARARNYDRAVTRRLSVMNREDLEDYRLEKPFRARPGMRLDPDFRVAMEKLRLIDGMVKEFPGIDCGSCGCPTCLAFAEDVVQGHASVGDCLYAKKRWRKRSAKGGEKGPRKKAQK